MEKIILFVCLGAVSWVLGQVVREFLDTSLHRAIGRVNTASIYATSILRHIKPLLYEDDFRNEINKPLLDDVKLTFECFAQGKSVDKYVPVIIYRWDWIDSNNQPLYLARRISASCIMRYARHFRSTASAIDYEDLMSLIKSSKWIPKD